MIKDLEKYTKYDHLDFTEESYKIIELIKYIQQHSKICCKTQIPVLIPMPKKISVDYKLFSELMLKYGSSIDYETLSDVLLISHIFENNNKSQLPIIYQIALREYKDNLLNNDFKDFEKIVENLKKENHMEE